MPDFPLKNAPPMIRIQALSHRYAAAATPALTDISLNSGRGEC